VPPRGDRPQSPTHTRRAALRLGGVALAAALLAACSGDDDGEPDADAPLPSLLAPEATIPPSVASGVLRLGALGEPGLPRALVYATLVAVDPRTARIHGDLAAAVEQPDPLAVTFRLREHASFHRGRSGDARPITSAEVARDFAIRASAGEFLFAQVVEAVEAPDPLTVQMRLRAPFALLFDQLGDPDAAAIRADSPSPLGVPLGSGPFVPERREDGGISLLAHPGYHQLGLPALDEVRIFGADRERTLDAAFESGALDIRALDDAESIARASERDDATQLSRSSRRARGLGLSLVGTKDGRSVRFRPAFQDQRVRRALSLALDREALVAFDAAVPAGPVGPGLAADALRPEELAEHALLQHDPEEAAKLLQAAGHALLTFSLEAPRTQPLRGLAQLITRQLRGAGMLPQLELVDDERLQQNLETGDFEAILFELEPVRSPDIGLRLHASGGLGGVFSPWGYSNPIYDEAVRDALLEIDPAERARASRAAQRLLLEDVPAMLALPERVERIAIANAVGAYEYDAYEFNDRALAPLWHLGGDAARAPAALPLAPGSG
jgi:peptide/nickel transport system substrate-binding protein